MRARADLLRSLLGEIPGVTVADLGRRPSGIVSFAVEAVPAARVRAALAERRVTVTVSGRSSTLLDMTDRGYEGLVRASPHYFVSEGQLEEAAAAVSELIST